ACVFCWRGRRDTGFSRDWSSDVCPCDLPCWGWHDAPVRDAPASPEVPVVRSAEVRLRGRSLPMVGPARIYVCGITPYDVTHLGRSEERRVGQECGAAWGGARGKSRPPST